MEKKEYILCSAVWYKDLKLKKIFDSANVIPINVDKGLVFCGFRHLQCMRTMGSITGLRSVRSVVGNYIQGFLTSKNRFVGREEAKIIALDAKQIVEPTINKTDLFSEDLW